MENMDYILGNKKQILKTPEDKEDVLDVRDAIENELSSVEVKRNENNEIINEDGLVSDFQDEYKYRYINTPSFKSWYHGPLSPRNEPTPFYHATGEYFDKFDPNLIASSRGFANLGAGFYLSFDEEYSSKETYLRIARSKQPRDHEKQQTILNHRENEHQLFDQIQIIQEKIHNLSDAYLNCYEKFDIELKEWIEKINAITIKREGLSYVDIKKEDFDVQEPSLLEKARLLLFDAELKKLIGLKLKVKEILDKKELEITDLNKKDSELRREKQILEQKKEQERQQIDQLMPEGIVLQTFANVKNLLNFNEPVDQEKLLLIKSKLTESSFDQTLLDKYLAKENSGEMLYYGLTKMITGKEFKLPRDLENGEEATDTKPVSEFLFKNNLYDANVYVSRFGDKTLVAYNANDVMIMPTAAS